MSRGCIHLILSWNCRMMNDVLQHHWGKDGWCSRGCFESHACCSSPIIDSCLTISCHVVPQSMSYILFLTSTGKVVSCTSPLYIVWAKTNTVLQLTVCNIHGRNMWTVLGYILTKRTLCVNVVNMNSVVLWSWIFLLHLYTKLLKWHSWLWKNEAHTHIKYSLGGSI